MTVAVAAARGSARSRRRRGGGRAIREPAFVSVCKPLCLFVHHHAPLGRVALPRCESVAWRGAGTPGIEGAVDASRAGHEPLGAGARRPTQDAFIGSLLRSSGFAPRLTLAIVTAASFVYLLDFARPPPPQTRVPPESHPSTSLGKRTLSNSLLYLQHAGVGQPHLPRHELCSHAALAVPPAAQCERMRVGCEGLACTSCIAHLGEPPCATYATVPAKATACLHAASCFVGLGRTRSFDYQQAAHTPALTLPHRSNKRSVHTYHL